MAERMEVDMRNRQADSLGADFDSGTLVIRTGAQPASADDAASGTLLVTITLPADAFAAASAGVAAKAGTWSGAAVATGEAGWFRMSNGAGTRSIDGAIMPEDLLNGAITDSATTITVDDTTGFSSTGTIRIESEDITYTGKTATTFTGCTRGANATTPAAHSDNVRVQGRTDGELGLNTNSITNLQTVTVSSFSITQPAS